MAPHPPPYLTGPHRRLFEALLVGLFVNACLAHDPGYQQDRIRILAIMDPELEVLHYAAEPEASVGQLLAALSYVVETLRWVPDLDDNELPF